MYYKNNQKKIQHFFQSISWISQVSQNRRKNISSLTFIEKIQTGSSNLSPNQLKSKCAHIILYSNPAIALRRCRFYGLNGLFFVYSVEWQHVRYLQIVFGGYLMKKSNWSVFGILVGLALVWGIIYWVFIVPK